MRRLSPGCFRRNNLSVGTGSKAEKPEPVYVPEMVSRPVSKRFDFKIIYRQQKKDTFYGIKSR